MMSDDMDEISERVVHSVLSIDPDNIPGRDIIVKGMKLIKEGKRRQAFDLFLDEIKPRVGKRQTVTPAEFPDGTVGMVFALKEPEHQTDLEEHINMNLDWITTNIALEMVQKIVHRDEDAGSFCQAMLISPGLRVQWHFNEEARSEMIADPSHRHFCQDIVSIDERILDE